MSEEKDRLMSIEQMLVKLLEIHGYKCRVMYMMPLFDPKVEFEPIKVPFEPVEGIPEKAPSLDKLLVEKIACPMCGDEQLYGGGPFVHCPKCSYCVHPSWIEFYTTPDNDIWRCGVCGVIRFGPREVK